MTVVGSFKGVKKLASYDVPVVVRVPEPKIRSQVWNRIDFGESGGGFVINRFYYTTGTGTFWVKSDQTLLETEVVLDESIVLPSKKYVQLGSGGGPTTVTTDASGKYSDADELQFYTSGSSIVEFTLPAELNRKLNGGVHSLRLRTKDPVGTRIDQNPLDRARHLHPFRPARKHARRARHAVLLLVEGADDRRRHPRGGDRDPRDSWNGGAGDRRHGVHPHRDGGPDGGWHDAPPCQWSSRVPPVFTRWCPPTCSSRSRRGATRARSSSRRRR